MWEKPTAQTKDLVNWLIKNEIQIESSTRSTLSNAIEDGILWSL